MVKIAQRLKQAREQTGKSPAEVATEVGLSHGAYYDLESGHDWFTSVDLKEVHQIAKAVGLTFAELMSGSGIPDSEQVNPEELRSLVQGLLNSEQLSVDDFENNIGWSVAPFLQNSAASEKWNVDCLRAVCDAAGANWLAFSLS